MNFGCVAPEFGTQTAEKFATADPSENRPEVPAADFSCFDLQSYFPETFLPGGAESPWDNNSEADELFSHEEFALDSPLIAAIPSNFHAESQPTSGQNSSSQKHSTVYRVLKPTKFLFNSKVVNSKFTQVKTGAWKLVGTNCLMLSDAQDLCLCDAEDQFGRAEDKQIEIPKLNRMKLLQGLKKKSRRESVETMITAEDIVAPPSSSRFIDCMALH